ncbi:hypothetical protein FH063_005506 [Azospirillum argentinense]|uniref:Uncharacterized protein n=1 Tax=Azospirillum argentinense TaxID=2970906 RepID=A0A5B0KUY8_9PROT|nr:hypothetical protein FH063_005506 [Azospirillum argentinense]
MAGKGWSRGTGGPDGEFDLSEPPSDMTTHDARTDDRTQAVFPVSAKAIGRSSPLPSGERVARRAGEGVAHGGRSGKSATPSP